MNLGLGGDVKVDGLVVIAIGEDLEAEALRKTRAGGNWLTGGIVIGGLFDSIRDCRDSQCIS